MSSCLCKDCKCAPFIQIGKDTPTEPRRIKVSCGCKTISAVTSGHDKRGEVKGAVELWGSAPPGWITAKGKEENDLLRN